MSEERVEKLMCSQNRKFDSFPPQTRQLKMGKHILGNPVDKACVQSIEKICLFKILFFLILPKSKVSTKQYFTKSEGRTLFQDTCLQTSSQKKGQNTDKSTFMSSMLQPVRQLELC